MRSLPPQVAKNMGFWREKLDYQFTKDYELVLVGGKCGSHEWDDECGCTRGMTGSNTIKSCTVWYLDTLTEAELMEEFDKSAYADELKFTYDNYKEAVVWKEFVYDYESLSIVRVIDGKEYAVKMETMTVSIPTVDVIY